jgi:hypothetical protein
MIVLKNSHVAEDVEFPGPLLVIESAAGGYTVSRLQMGSGPSLTITASDIEPWGRRVYYWSAYGDGFIQGADYEESRDYDSFMRSRFGCVEGPVLVAARGGAGELALVSVVPTRTSLPAIRHEVHGPSIEAVERVIPGYINSARARTNKAKRDLLEKLSPVSIMAEQEKQIDLLSTLVIGLVEQRPESERPEWFGAFKQMIEQQSSAQFKGAAGALTDITERKQRLRDLQRAYFSQRA